LRDCLRVLLTGGIGYIGSHFSLELLKHGHYPIIVDNLTTSEISTLDALRLVSGKIIPFYEVHSANSAELKKILIRVKIYFLILAVASKKSKEINIKFPILL